MRWASVRCRRKERGCDFLGGESANLAQRKCDLRVGRERRVAAREDQAQPVVFDDALFERGRRIAIGGRIVHLGVERFETRLATDLVDGLEAPRGNQPGARVLRHAFGRPFFERRAKGFVQRFLGEIKIAQQADQRCQDRARVGPIDRIDSFMRMICGLGVHVLANGVRQKRAYSIGLGVR